MFGGVAVSPDVVRALDGAEADVLLARGRLLHAGFLAGDKEDDRELSCFERAARLYVAAGDRAGEATALFWVGCYHHIVRGDLTTAVPVLERSRDLAQAADQPLTLSYALRHLGIAAHQAKDLESARQLLEESTALRRALGFDAGVAANLVGLIWITVAQQRHHDGRALYEEAIQLAAAAGATAVLAQLQEASDALESAIAATPPS